MKKYAFPVQRAKEAILLGLYSEALSLLKPLSVSGNTEAQFLHAYLHFWDDELDRGEAVELMEHVAKSGHVEANYILAVCPNLSPGYIFKLPVSEQGQDYLYFAAEHESDMALTDLADCYAKGLGVEQNLSKARDLLQQIYNRTSGTHRFAKNCFMLGKMLLEGRGGNQDVNQGMRALRRCVFAYGDPYADKACSLYIEIVEQGKYGFDVSQGHDLEDLRTELERIRAKNRPNWQRYLYRYCLTTLQYDLRSVSFDRFVSFIFEHFQVQGNDRDGFRWWSDAEVLFDDRQLLRYYTQLFREPAFLLDHYTRDEIERGLGMNGIRGFANWTVGCVMRSSENTVDDTEACIHAMYDLFAKLFARVSFDTVEYMWWDVGYGACDGAASPKRDMEDGDYQRLYQATFDTMTRVLQLDARNCQSAAVHGLGHSSHPNKEKVLLQFLEDNPDLSDRDKSYVMEAIQGKIL